MKARINAQMLKHTIGDLLSYSLIDSSQFSLSKAWTRLKDLVGEVIALVEQSMIPGVRLLTHIDAELHSRIFVDAPRLR